jgi:hypothetical protein
MGEMQKPWLEAPQLQQNTLLNVETGHAQAAYCIDALNAVVGAQLAMAHSALVFVASAQIDPERANEMPAADFGTLAAGQAAYAKALTDAGDRLTRKSAELSKAYWSEQQRQMKALLDL